MQRTQRSLTICNGEIGLRTPHRLSDVFSRDRQHRSPLLSGEPSLLYLVCKSNDLERVKSCLKKMKREDIDCQYSSNNETALHVATRNQNKEIILLLLAHGAQRSLKNIDGQQAYQLAQTNEIRELFKRSKSPRFFCLNDPSQTTSELPQKIQCKSCSLVNDRIFYEWELVDQNASKKALRFRQEFKQSVSMNGKILKEKLYSIKKGYLSLRLPDVPNADHHRIQDYFQRASVYQKPDYIITAYTICQHFSHLLNTDMARNVIHDLKNGCSKFCCDCLYSTEDGTKSITNILLHHPRFQELNFQGQVYRGLVVPKNALCHYEVGSCIITTTFLSTSRNPAVARIFCDNGKLQSTTESFFCVYEIVNNDRTALDISEMSEYEHEEEVLILPYSAFLITKIEETQGMTMIYLKEQSLKEIFGDAESNEHFSWSFFRRRKKMEPTVAQNTSEVLLKENSKARPRSKTLPTFFTCF